MPKFGIVGSVHGQAAWQHGRLDGAADNFSFGKTRGKMSRAIPHGAPRMMPLLPENLSRK
jgi:hypothetical protein